ncbi:transcriptional regulator [Billgrantia azerbaijanica]|nr:transcriptional regulator [Halomonas azerbaijanica]
MPTPEPPGLDEAEPTSTVALLYRQFGDVLIPLEDVRRAYFRNRSAERFRRALREGTIPLPIVRLDESHKGQGYICLHQLAAYIEWRARRAALQQESADCSVRHHHRLHRALIDAVPTTDPAGATRRG